MIAEQICYNGNLQPAVATTALGDFSLGLPAVYQHIRVLPSGPCFLDTHLRILRQAFEVLYPKTRWPLPQCEVLGQQFVHLLSANGYSLSGAVVTLRLSPEDPEGERASAWSASIAAPLYYPQYELWHFRPALFIFPCEYLYMGYPTSLSAQIGAYGTYQAARIGAQCALTETCDGILTNIDDEPLFVRIEKRLYTSPLACGATDSVMRRLILEAARLSEIPSFEEPLTRTMLTACDECFTATPQGLVSIASLNNRRYFNILPAQLLSQIRQISTKTLLPFHP